MTVHERFTAAVADLAAQGITAVFDTRTLHPDDAWTETVRRHGPRVAVAAEYGAAWYSADEIRYHENGHDYRVRCLWFDHPHDDLTVGEAVAAAFIANGFDVEWDGEPDITVRVHLT